MSTRLLFLLSIITFISPTISTTCTSNANTGFRASLRHINANCGLPKDEIISRAVQRSSKRVKTLFSTSKISTTSTNPVASTRILVQPNEGEYLMDLAIGTPPRPYSAMIDTGSDLIWTQCTPCVLCVDQPTPYFDPLASKTFFRHTCSSSFCQALDYPLCFSNICVYMYSYSDGANTAGVLANETFTFGISSNNVTVPNIAFGCGNLNEGSLFNGSGMVGLGRGPLSLVNQLGPSKFAYCLTYFFSPISSPLLFGSMANLNNTNVITGPVQSTPFIINTALPSLYYVSLIGITVGTALLPIPASAFALNLDGTGGVIIDSGTSISYLQMDAYNLVKQAFQTQVNLSMVSNDNFGLDICFPWPPPPFVTVKIPSITFHFDGANMTLPELNYMLYDGSTGLYCVGIGPSTDGSIIGNFQQQDMYVLYDLENGLLSFAPARCDQM
ncbi:Eukaryotic aspartyl protease family protein [Rhynchospora pubera]|uniref:Eukaryotic aspartyl protease family protein n=1 Tax=Rhynchospora pubera TaxID=906938 RepID=A0AAV8G5I7_9POAL|nr:Eukaryotic aspartyl protease family protein [Rhynchospora pubera]